MKINKKYILVIVLFIFVICLSFLNKPRVLLSEVKLIDENKNVKSYAIMLSEDGTNYSESESNMIPSTGYKLNTSMSYCVTLTGDTLHGVISEPLIGTVKVDVANTVNCYLYYDPDNSAFATVIEESDYTLYTDEADLEAGTFYRYSGAYDGKRNVIYADHCWQIFRTTKNNSIKMIYNGEPAYNSTLYRYTCENDRTNTDYIGFTGGIQTLGSSSGTTYNYYYGTGYYYDETAGAYKLSGEVGPYNWYNDHDSLIGMYTCKNTTANANCTMGNIYYVDAYSSQTQAYVFTINTGMTYDRIGMASYNYRSASPAAVGYMFKNEYNILSKSARVNMLEYVSNSNYNNYYYGDRIEGSSSLINPELGSSITGHPQSWVGKYTLKSSNQSNTNTTSYYISGVKGGSYPNVYYATFNNQTTKDSAINKYLFGTGYTSNGDGTVTMTGAKEISKGDWYTAYNNGDVAAGNYVCLPETYTFDSANNTGVCSNGINSVTSSDIRSMVYIPVNIKYGYSFEERTVVEQQDGKGKYKLVGNNDLTNSLQIITDWYSDYVVLSSSPLKNSHYTCFNEDGICDTLYFVTHTVLDNENYITLSQGETIQNVIDMILNDDDINVINSTIKDLIDLWYKEYILDTEDSDYNQYSSYLDTDEIFCNNRYVTNPGGWSQTGNTTLASAQLGFVNWNKISCIDNNNQERVVDEFSVTSGNGALIYPMGLPSYGEMYLLLNNNVRKSPYENGINYWISSPAWFQTSAIEMAVSSSGTFSSDAATSQHYGVRPSLSLNRNVIFSSGDGTMTNPWIASLE